MSAAPDMPISDAREHFADVVNQVAYGGRLTYVTRRGKRVAMILPVNHAAAEAAKVREEAEAAKAHEEAIAEVCREMWTMFKDDPDHRDKVRDSIDKLISKAEEASDVAAVDAALAERKAGAETVPWEQVKAELGL